MIDPVRIQNAPADENWRGLTPREAQCLQGVADLKPTREIANDLTIAFGTVEGYINSAMRKLGARDRKEAARMWRAAHPVNSSTAIDGMAPDRGFALDRGQAEGGGAKMVTDVSLDRDRIVEPAHVGLAGALIERLVTMAPGRMPTWLKWSIILATAVAGGLIFLAISVAFAAIGGLATAIHNAIV